MKSTQLLLACAVMSAFAMTGCHHDDDDTAPSSAMVTTPAPPPNAETPAAPTSAPPLASSDATPPASSPLTFEQLDQNKDGSLTKDELQADDLLRRNFDQADANHDGKLSKSEVETYRSANAGVATDVASPG